MLENEEILFENLLGEPETTRPDEIILGDGEKGSCSKYDCETDACSSHGCGIFVCNSVSCPKNECKEFTCTTNCPSNCVSDVCGDDWGGCPENECNIDCGGYCESNTCPNNCALDSCGEECANYGYVCSSDSDDNPCYGYNCPTNGCQCYSEGSSVTRYFRYYVGFRLHLRGTYSVLSSMSYTLRNYRFNARVQASNGNVSMPLSLLGCAYVQDKLYNAQTNNLGYIDVYKSGITTFLCNTGANLQVPVCGVSIPVTATTGSVYAMAGSGRIKYMTSANHAAKTYIPISCFTMVQRVTSSTVGGNNSYWDTCVDISGKTYISLYEKPVVLLVTDSANSTYRLQGAQIEITNNSGGLTSNKFVTGNYGYIRAFTSGNTATGYTAKIERSGYTVTTRTFSYHTSSASPINHISQATASIPLVKSYYEAPSLTRLKLGLFGGIISVQNENINQCHTPSQLYANHISAVTGNILTQTVFTGNSLGRFVDIKGIKNYVYYETDEYLTGKSAIYLYNPGVKSSTGISNYTQITAITHQCLGIKIQTPQIAISASTAHVGKCKVSFRLYPSNGGVIFYDYLYSEPINSQYVVIPSYQFNYSNGNITAGANVPGFILMFAVIPLNNESLTNSVTAKTISGNYYYYPILGTDGGVSPTGYTPSN